MPESPDIVAMGEPMGEFNATRGSGEYLFGYGGDTSNAAIAAARHGASVGYLTAVGDDETGRAFLDLWAREGVDTSRVLVDGQAHTGIYFVNHGPNGHSFSYLRAGSAASRVTPGALPRDYVAGAKVLHLSAISQAISTSACDTCFAAIEAAREAGVMVCYDTNLRLKLWPLPRARAIIQATCAMADLVRPGLDDAQTLTGLEHADDIVDLYLKLGAKIVAITLGKDGSLVATPERRERVPGITVKAVDATGAGDAYDGAFLAEYLRTGDPFASARYANVAAALSTTGYGAVAPLPRRADVEARLAAG